MSVMPESIQKSVEKTLEQVDIYGFGDGGGMEIYSHRVEEAITHAILAERKRCAEIASKHAATIRLGGINAWHGANTIAQEIEAGA